MEVVYLLAVIFIGVGYIVRTIMVERTKRLAASKETPPEVIEHLARMEARLDEYGGQTESTASRAGVAAKALGTLGLGPG